MIQLQLQGSTGHEPFLVSLMTSFYLNSGMHDYLETIAGRNLQEPQQHNLRGANRDRSRYELLP